VIEEADLAERAGAFLLPIGATGGAAETIAARLLGSAVLSTGTQAQRPTDNELKNLGDKDASEEKLVKAVMSVIDRVSGTLAS
jgi:hypothetical protein